MDSLLLNASQNATNATDLSEYEWLFVTTGVLHILFAVVPVLVMGPIVLAPFIANKKLRDPVSVVYMFTIVLCVSGPATYGLMMDVGLIGGVESFGPCLNTHNTKIFLIFFLFWHNQLLVTNAFLTILQNIAIRHGVKKVSSRLAIVIILALIAYSFAGSMLIFVAGTAEVVVRGSLCSTTGLASIIIGVTSISLYTIPSILVIGIFSYKTIKHVKKRAISDKNSQAVRRLTKLIVIWLTVSVCIRSFAAISPVFTRLPIMPEQLKFFSSFLTYYVADLNFPLFLILSLFLHARVRESVRRNLVKLGCLKKPAKTEKSSHTETSTSIANIVTV